MDSKEIQDWLISQVAERLHIVAGTIDIHEPLANYGLTSLDAVTLSGDLEELLGRQLSPSLAYEYPSIALLSQYLSANNNNKTAAENSKPLQGISDEPIAVIGISCRFPGARDPESFWQLLSTGTDAISEVPGDRWKKDAFYHPDPSMPGKAISYWGGFLDCIDQFDPFFFGISPLEAENMDPQQRLLLELSYEALDDAGQVKADFAGTKTGVFIGISLNEYSQYQFNDPSIITSHSGTGNALSIAANRISYYFDFHGPSMAIDTACSSSLAAVHLACRSLKTGECKMALAGGVNMILSPAHSIAFTKAGVLAPDGRCKSFDARANGYVRGEGGGVIVLKPLSSALADGDHIYALIPGSAMNQDGRTNGLMAPSREAQEAMLQEAYNAAGISPGSVHYIETHGTGTILGDSMEAKAIGAVIGVDRMNGSCAIGSVKTNIGHLEAAAGIAGLIKVILSLKHRMILPSLHYQSPNPYIPFDELHIRVQNELGPWPSHSGPALAGVSSFGFGGTNVHVVVQEADQHRKKKENTEQVQSTASHCYLLPLSANSFKDLHAMAGTFHQQLAADNSVSIKDICFSAGLRRSEYDHRLAVIGNSREELCSSLEIFLEGEQAPGLFYNSISPGRPLKLVFVFPGQGGQWYGMGRELLHREPVFFTMIERIDRAIKVHCSWSLLELLGEEESASGLTEIDVVQPMLFAIQVALAELWQSWGIKPHAVVGHSMGEVAAAYIAGILSLEDAVQVICCRSQLLKKLRGKGSMLATGLTPEQAKELLKEYDTDKIAIAAINSPLSTVLSGDPGIIDEIMNSLLQQDLFCKLVNVDVASHSPQMDQVYPELLKALDNLNSQPAKLPIYSTVTGTLGDELLFNARYWMDNLRKPVLFSDAIGQLLDNSYTTFIEMGPHPILLSYIRQSISSQNAEIRLIPSLVREKPEVETLFGALAALYTEGYSIAWNKLYPGGRKHIQLPLIKWQRQRYWVNTKSSNSKKELYQTEGCGKKSHPLLGERIRLANSSSAFIWQTNLDTEVLPFLADHQVDNEIIFPAAAYIEMALQAAEETNLKHSHELTHFLFLEKMILETGKPRPVQTLLTPDKEGSLLFTVYSRTEQDDNWRLNASVKFLPLEAAVDLEKSAGTSPDRIRQQSTAQFTAEKFYQRLQENGMQYGPGFQGVQQAWGYNDNESLGRISLPGALQYDTNDFQIHPALLDSCLQVLAATQNITAAQDLYIPTGCKRVRFFLRTGKILWSQVFLHPVTAAAVNFITADIRLLNENTEMVAELIGFQIQRSPRHVRRMVPKQDSWLYQVNWQASAETGTPAGSLQEGKHWLIFADHEGMGEALAKQLETGGHSCHLLFWHEANQQLDKRDEFILLETIEQQLKEAPSPLYGIIHLWSLSIPHTLTGDAGIREKMQLLGCNSVLVLVQALAKRLAGLPNLWLVTRGAQSVRSGDPVNVEQSPLWGLGKVISFEFPELNCTRIDIDLNQSITETVPLLLKQVLVDDRENEIAFRGGVRFVPRLLPFLLSPSGSSPVSLRPDGTYLVTGGLGGLGLNAAKWMISRGARHLVLLGRTEPSLEVMEIVDQLKKEAAEVVIAQVDVIDPLQLQTAIQKIGQKMPPLRGVIHAAGVLDDGSLLNLDTERMKNVMAPKVNGTWNLHIATLDMPLDFFVLFSSVVSVLGSPGQGNYAAASSYLDSMAYYRRNLGLPVTCINWGPWAEVGLAAEITEKLKEQNGSTQHLIKVIKIDQGFEILERLLTESTPQVIVLPFDLSNLLELYPIAAGMPFFAEVGSKNSPIARLYARPNLRQKYIAPRNDIERKIADLWRQTLHIDQVGVHDSFFELGGDSVLAAQILSLAQKSFGIRINPQDAFKAFTIERLAEMLKAALLSKIEAMSESEAREQLSKTN